MIRKTVVISAVALGVFAAGAVASQRGQGDPKRVSQGTVLQQPEIIAGPDVGFRVGHYTSDGVPVGELVVKKDGKWIAVEFGARMKLTK